MAKSPYQSASLYVGDLDKSVTEAILFEAFKVVDRPVASIRVCRDAMNRQSLGYAYVNFHTIADAAKALDEMNFQPIGERPCRIMWSQRDPSIRRSGRGNIFIKNLHKSINNKALYDTFTTFGNILSSKVVMDGSGESRGYGFVHYETEEEAQAAIDGVNEKILAGQMVEVSRFVPRNKRANTPDGTKYTNLYIKHFPVDWDKEKLIEVFSAYGEIQNAAIKQAKLGEDVKSFGFVNFVDAESAQKAVDDLNGTEKYKSEGITEPLYCQRAMKKGERRMHLRNKKNERAKKYQGINLYIKNLHDSIDDDKLYDVFAPFGKITSHMVMKDANGATKGFGFVCFSQPEEAKKAITQMNSAMIAGKPLFVTYHERKEVRQAKLAQLHARNRMKRGAMYGSGPVYYPQGFVYPFPGGYPPNQRPGPYMPYNQQQAMRGPGGAQVVPAHPHPHPGNREGVPPGEGNATERREGQGPPGTQPPAQAQPQAAPAKTDVEGINYVKTLEPQDQKQAMGELLYPKISALEPQAAAKITGMFLESLSFEELTEIAKSETLLREKITEAMAVLREYEY